MRLGPLHGTALRRQSKLARHVACPYRPAPKLPGQPSHPQFGSSSVQCAVFGARPTDDAARDPSHGMRSNRSFGQRLGGLAIFPRRIPRRLRPKRFAGHVFELSLSASWATPVSRWLLQLVVVPTNHFLDRSNGKAQNLGTERIGCLHRSFWTHVTSSTHCIPW